VDCDDAARARADLRFNGRGVDIEGGPVDIDQYRAAAAIAHHIGGGDISQSWHDDFVARLEAERNQGQMQRACSVAGRYGMAHAAEFGEFSLEVGDETPD